MAESFPSVPGGTDGGSFPLGSDPSPADVTPSQDSLLFRRYRIERELGRGGMGVVLLAHDTALEISVALKLVPDHLNKDTEAVSDLRKEVLRGMALMHPGIVRTHNFERDEKRAGIVMEYIDGETLTALRLRQPNGCYDADQILRWVEQLCTVLNYAHQDARIVHRDLKPRNVMVTATGKLKVADFGIAAVITESVTRHSMEGRVSGTPCYMSPQQAQGKRPTHLDDIHAIGALIFELLTSKPPFFRGDTDAILYQVINVVPPSMAQQREDLEIHGMAPIPVAWEGVVAACLAKDPSERPQSAIEVVEQLRSGVDATNSPTRVAQPVAAEPPPAVVAPPVAPESAPTPVSPPPASVPSSGRNLPVAWIAGGMAAVGIAVWAGLHWAPADNRPDEDERMRTPRLATPIVPAKPTPIVPAPTPPATPVRDPAIAEVKPKPVQLPRPRTGVDYQGEIKAAGVTMPKVILIIRFDRPTSETTTAAEPLAGTMTQSANVGDTIVRFAGRWDGAVFRAHTGDVIRKAERVQWEAEEFTLTLSGKESSAMTYASSAEGATYRAELTAR